MPQLAKCARMQGSGRTAQVQSPTRAMYCTLPAIKMQQAQISKYFSTTSSTTSSSTSTDAGDEAEGGVISSSTEGEQESNSNDLTLRPPLAKRACTKAVTRDHHRRTGFNLSWYVPTMAKHHIMGRAAGVSHLALH